jgi:hypothetical protein
MIRPLVPALAVLGIAAAACSDTTAPATAVPAAPRPEFAVVTFGLERIGNPATGVFATGINDAGQIAGTTQFGTAAPLGFIWGAGATQLLFNQLPFFNSHGNDVNDFGVAAGAGIVSNTSIAAVVWDGGVPTPLASYYTGGFASADVINNVGKILGSDVVDGSPHVSLVWSDKTDPTPTAKRDGKGTVSVAVLGSRWFRPADVNPTTLTLGNDDGVDTPVLRKRGTPVTRLTDLNRDGFPDLVADFGEREMMNRGDLPAGSPVLVLLEQLRDGTHLRGTDVVTAQ